MPISGTTSWRSPPSKTCTSHPWQDPRWLKPAADLEQASRSTGQELYSWHLSLSLKLALFGLNHPWWDWNKMRWFPTDSLAAQWQPLHRNTTKFLFKFCRSAQASKSLRLQVRSAWVTQQHQTIQRGLIVSATSQHEILQRVTTYQGFCCVKILH